MPLIEPESYYEDREVEHSAFGDIHVDVPFFVATADDEEEGAPRGARKRPAIAVQPPLVAPGIVSSYTCGFTAQPPGTPGYSHPFRLMAPLMSMTALKAFGVKANELRKVKEHGFVQGLMYLPVTEGLGLDEIEEADEEFARDAAALLYRPALVTQALLDGRDRVHRLTASAQRILSAALIQVMSPNRFDPFDAGLRDPDLTDSWSQ